MSLKTFLSFQKRMQISQWCMVGFPGGAAAAAQDISEEELEEEREPYHTMS